VLDGRRQVEACIKGDDDRLLVIVGYVQIHSICGKRPLTPASDHVRCTTQSRLSPTLRSCWHTLRRLRMI
jgi:phospho-2-dehydro-3-deoxyheptonate aldolase